MSSAVSISFAPHSEAELRVHNTTVARPSGPKMLQMASRKPSHCIISGSLSRATPVSKPRSMQQFEVRTAFSARRSTNRASTLRFTTQAAKYDSSIKESRTLQIDTTDILAELLKSEDPQKVAQKHVDKLGEQFFTMASTYLEMAKKEGNKEVEDSLEHVMNIAMSEVNKTLRPEIRLFNQMFRTQSVQERRQILEESKEHLVSDNKYFFTLVKRMHGDMVKAKMAPQRDQHLKQLMSIQREAEAVVKDFNL